MKKTLFVIGTRPEAIKICPIINEFKNRKEKNILLLTTGQHKEMLDLALADFGIDADFSFEVMKDGQTLGELTGRLLFELERAFDMISPSRVVVHGDTLTALSAALTAFYKGIEVAHVEAGLRSDNINEPFPEEFDRRVISVIAALHFAPTKLAKKALIDEGVPKDKIFITGNTVTDALFLTRTCSFDLPRGMSGSFAILTVHRRENLCRLKEIFHSIAEARAMAGLDILYPVHKNPEVLRCADEVFFEDDGIFLTDPMSVREFHFYLRRCAFVITDSGGVQEEAAFLGKPIILLRNTTERKELLSYKGLKIVGTDEMLIKKAVVSMAKKYAYRKYKRKIHPIGERGASVKIADILSEL